MTEADLKAASDFIHEWINEEAKLHGSSHMRVVRDALAALIHDQRQAALKEGLTLTVDGLGFKEEPIVLISGPSERMKACYDACAGLNPEAIPALVHLVRKVADQACDHGPQYFCPREEARAVLAGLVAERGSK